MTHRAPGRKSALLGLSAVACLVLGMLSPAAHAQVPGLDVPIVNDVPLGGGGSDGGGGGGGGSSDGGGSSGGGSLVGSVVDNVVEVTDKTTDPIGNVVEDTGKAVGSDTIEQTGKTLGNTTKTVGETVNKSVKDVTDGLGQAIHDAGGGLLNPDLLVNNPRNPRGNRPKGDNNNGGGGGGVQGGNRGGSTGSGEVVKGDRFGSSNRNPALDFKLRSMESAEARRRHDPSITTASASVQHREGFITRLADAAAEATKKLAFPLGLALMVGAFLMVQGRIDRKDAKLVLAPINSEQDLLSFQ